MNDDELKQILALFERWFMLQFGKHELLIRTEAGGYQNSETNAMWVGFCVGHTVANI